MGDLPHSFIVFYSWISSSFPRPPAKRAVAIALINAFSQLGNVAGSYVWSEYLSQPIQSHLPIAMPYLSHAMPSPPFPFLDLSLTKHRSGGQWLPPELRHRHGHVRHHSHRLLVVPRRPIRAQQEARGGRGGLGRAAGAVDHGRGRGGPGQP